MSKPRLSIVILSYNTKDLLEGCLKSLERVRNEVDFEIIVVDNGSTDGSQAMVEKYLRKSASTTKKVSRDKRGEVVPIRVNSRKQTLKLIENRTNLGFAAGNNRARKFCRGKYVLFLNSDTIVNKNTLKKCVEYIDKDSKVGALTCKLVLPTGELDKDARRSFITPWIGLVHIFLKLDRLFPKSKTFGKYWYGYISPDKIHEVDALQGAFFLTRKTILDKVDWFDEDYFLDGEDIDLSWKIKRAGWKIIYYPKVTIVHLKGATKGKNTSRFSDNKTKVSISEKMKYEMSGVNSMEIFVRKRLWSQYPLPLIILVIFGIKILKTLRFMKLLIYRIIS